MRFFSQPDWLFADLGARYCDDEAGAIFGCKALSNTPAGVAASTSRCRGRVPSFSDGLSHHLNRTGKYLPGSFCSILIILADELVGSTRAETCATSPSRARCRLANGLSVRKGREGSVVAGIAGVGASRPQPFRSCCLLRTYCTREYGMGVLRVPGAPDLSSRGSDDDPDAFIMGRKDQAYMFHSESH